MAQPTVIDLFCGIGGFSKGFEKAGFNILMGVDNWETALKTFERNHKNSIPFLFDISKKNNPLFEEYKGKVDIIIAGPPCQGFSMSGKRNTGDSRNSLFEEVIRVSSIIKPKIIVIENVVGLLSMKNLEGELIQNLIIKKFYEIGYLTEYRILNAADYGVPQRRRRVIFIASRIGQTGFPSPIYSKKSYIDIEGKEIKSWITVRNALGNIPDVGADKYLQAETEFQKMMSSGFNKIYNHEPTKHNKDVVARMSFVPPGGNWKNIPDKYYNVGGEHSNNYRRLDPDKPSITIKHAAKSMIIHPVHNRTVTVREVARLQSFFDSFILCGTKFEQHQQLANAVPPLLGFEIAKHLYPAISKDKPRSSSPLKNKKKKMQSTFIDLFSGIGGFRVALNKIGAKCVFSSDIDKQANETYFLNFGEQPKGDIKKIPSENIPDHDILCAGFPCQAFSIAGYRKGFKDTRGTLFFEVARILKEKRPKAFILENVKGIISHDNGKTIRVIRNALKEIGYVTFEKVMALTDYGLPQNRQRWFCVGFREECQYKKFIFPEPFPLKCKISDILDNNVEGYGPTETAWRHIQKYYSAFVSEKQGNPDRKTLVTQIRPSKCAMRDDGISPCLTAKMGTGGNNIPVIVELKRKLTEKECLRLMGFPENFKIKKGSYQSYKQIGNSVPVVFIELIAKEVLKYIR